jgi:eukaryotic-like serine/threonine-protein kinase
VYRLSHVIGRGGMSYVFEAEDTLLSRRVAIKFADDRRGGFDIVMHEARALAAVHHPALPVVHGVGVQDGATYVVLERLYGGTLELRLRQTPGAMPLAEAVDILAPIAEALAAVHAAGLAHRDVKPANVMLCAGRTVLLDFGIVLPEISAGPGEGRGSPRYMAPELVNDAVTRGSAWLVDTYAFGVMAYEMLAGRPPFVSESLFDLLDHHVHTAPPSLAGVRPDLPSRVVDVVDACLQKAPGDRPHDLREVARVIRSTSGTRRGPPAAAWSARSRAPARSDR